MTLSSTALQMSCSAHDNYFLSMTAACAVPAACAVHH